MTQAGGPGASSARRNDVDDETEISREDGEAKTTVQEVAARAGIGVGSLYDWFEDRGSVLAGVVVRVTAQNLQRFEEKLADTRRQSLEGSTPSSGAIRLHSRSNEYAASSRAPSSPTEAG